MPQMYSVASGLQEILARKKDEALKQQALERQAMLDELNRRKIEAEMETDKANAEAMKVYREGMAENYKAQADQRNVQSLDDAGFSRGTDLTGQISDRMLQSGKDAGRIVSINPEAYKGNEEAYAEGNYFTGNPLQQRVASLIESGAVTDPSQIMKFQALAAFGDKNLPANFFESPTVPAYKAGPDGGLVFDKNIPRDAKITQADATRQPPQPQLLQIPDPENPGQFFQRWGQPGDPEALKPPPPTPPSTKLPSGDIQLNPRPTAGGVSGLPVYRGNVPQSVSKPQVPSTISTQQGSAMRAALNALARAQSGAPGTNLEQAQQGLAVTQNQIIDSNLSDDSLKLAVRWTLSRPDKDQTPTQALIADIEANGKRPLTPEEKERLYSVLLHVLGRSN